PGVVRAAIPDAWSKASPAQMVEARLMAADLTLRESLGSDVIESADMVEAANLARTAAESCDPGGRPLVAAHSAVPRPDEPPLGLWFAITLLREYRGDGHIASLVTEGIDGCESLITHGAAGDIPMEILKSTRQWPDDEWDAARARLEARGWLRGDFLNPRGQKV